jgi:hypothetical protein
VALDEGDGATDRQFMNRWAAGVRVVAAAGLLVSAGCLVGVARVEGDTAALVRALAMLPGGGSDGARYTVTGEGAWVLAAIAAALAGGIFTTRRRTLYALGAICSLVSGGVGLWVALTSEPLVRAVALGPLAVSRPAIAAVLIVSAAVAFGASLLALASLPGLPAPARPSYMPPATHQG